MQPFCSVNLVIFWNGTEKVLPDWYETETEQTKGAMNETRLEENEIGKILESN